MWYEIDQAKRRLKRLLPEYPNAVIVEQFSNLHHRFYYVIKLIDEKRNYYGID